MHTTFTHQKTDIEFPLLLLCEEMVTKIGSEEWKGGGRDWWQQTRKEAGLPLFYLYIHMIKTEDEEKSTLCGGDKDSPSSKKRKQSTWQTERDLRRSRGQRIRVQFIRLCSFSYEFELIVAGREKVLESRRWKRRMRKL